MLRTDPMVVVFSLAVAAATVIFQSPGRAWAAQGGSSSASIPVILDTDIGDDIDDTWALALLLRSPELDLKLVVGDKGKSQYRARLLAKLLQVAGRTDVPVGVGIDLQNGQGGRQEEWIKGYQLSDYPGQVFEDGVQAMIDVIMKSPTPVTLIAIGPVSNLKVALEREPRIAQKARFVGMHGSVRVGYGGSQQPSAEYNVRADIPACQAVFTAPWEMLITPLDTCGLVHLRGAKYARARDARDPLTQAVIANYRVWWAHRGGKGGDPQQAERASSTLFDTVAVYLAAHQDLCQIETLKLRVDDRGFTVIDPQGKAIEVASRWTDLGKFEDFLVRRLAR